MRPANPSGLCQCGCGQRTNPSGRTSAKLGYKRGEPVRFIREHHQHPRARLTSELWTVEDRGFTTPCWIWLGAPWGPSGYSRVKFRDKMWLAHRAMYEQEVGPIPEGMQIDHLCSVRMCVNPAHLESVTPAENVHRSRSTKLTEADVRLIRASALPGKTLAEQYGVSRALISKIIHRACWKNVV